PSITFLRLKLQSGKLAKFKHFLGTQMITPRINRSLRALLPVFLACVSSAVYASAENATAPMNSNLAAGESPVEQFSASLVRRDIPVVVEFGHVTGPIEDFESFDNSQDHLNLSENVDAFLNGKSDTLFGFDSRVTPR
ncbi:MAG TPA: hypothetical protein PLI59_21960, partial [Candidatus Obscuribacter sp.]|nr:hypothetical protein [Candidatus Obscuribacter sp.]